MSSCEVWVAFNRLIARVTVPRTEAVRHLEIMDPATGRTLMSTRDGQQPFKSRTHRGPNIDQTFISALPLERGILPSVLRGLVDLVISQDDERIAFRVKPRAMSFELFATLDWPALDSLAKHPDVMPVAALVRRHGAPQAQGQALHLDYCHAANDNLFLNGWMADFGRPPVYFFSAGCALVTSSDDALLQRRADVTQFLRGANQPVTSDMHGFCIAIEYPAGDLSMDVVMIDADGMKICHAATPAIQGDPGRMYQLLAGAKQSASADLLTRISAQAAGFLQGASASHDHVIVRKSDLGRAPALSVIVPFYKEARFLYSILSMVRDAPADWEWVIVCDDMNILPELRYLIGNQTEETRRRITFVATQQNVGFGNANNIGVRHAAAPRVLLMNSDIWMRDFSEIAAGFQPLDAGDYALVGYTLRFEDGSIQHAGMDFRRADDFGGMYLAEHPGKGFPPSERTPAGAISTVGAVTGALMLLAKTEFERIGGFNNRYIGGDFEDADICLTLRAEGRKVGLVHSRQIFHLERQSIRQDAANNIAEMRTLVNCERFNARWASQLDSGAVAIASTVREAV